MIPMIRNRLLIAILFSALLGVVVCYQDAAADDYVWTRSGFGSMPLGHNASSFSNGYGGYYVRRNAYGNNQESRRPFTNPTGFIVPAQAATNCPTPTRNVAPVMSTQPTLAPVQPPQGTVQPVSAQQPFQPYRLSRVQPN